MLKKLVALLIVLAIVVGGAVWWFVLRDDAPEKLSVGGGGSSAAVGEVPESLDGTWTVASDSDSTVGFRISEDLAGGLANHEAVGRSTAVTGSFTIAGTEVTEGEFTVDLTALEFTDDPGLPVANRARALQGRGLQTNQFPEATFELTKPIDLGEAPEAGETIDATATGELTLHGVTKEITFAVQAKLDGNTVQIGTNPDDLPEIVLADYDIEVPTAPMVASIADSGTFEFLVTVTLS